MPYKFEVYKDRAEEFRVRFRARNGEKMFATEGYTSKAAAMGAIRSIMKNASSATIEDQTKATKAARKAKTASKRKASKRKGSKRRTTRRAK